MIERLVHWSRVKSPWVLHLNTGACNACDIEILAALMPRFDLERFGILLKGTPRHADVIICTGPITRQSKDRIVRDLRTGARTQVRRGRRRLRHVGLRLPRRLQRPWEASTRSCRSTPISPAARSAPTP